jgi:predicted O-methyltransferase YrrM
MKEESVFDLEGIEQFIIDAGSDDVPTFGGSFEGGIHLQQVPDEIAPCILALMESGEQINSYLEIGVAAGGTTYLFNHFFHPGQIVLIDDNKHHKAGLRADILKGIAYQEIIGRSDDEASIAIAAGLGPFDVILIDGGHLYPCVKADVTNYLPMLRPGGFLIMHDSAIPPPWGSPQVVTELKGDPCVEFAAEWVSKTHWQPCGVALFRRAA